MTKYIVIAGLSLGLAAWSRFAVDNTSGTESVYIGKSQTPTGLHLRTQADYTNFYKKRGYHNFRENEGERKFVVGKRTPVSAGFTHRVPHCNHCD